ncbi:E3 ubiquitin-protein ligase RNF170-like [Mya arenaria]|uniref:E3 ubiquitin-protein ligase RNF170-like n=1 Tax=Mya arenaria TaxID=6604 RepID=UPI0022E78E32|nr:E3 ubiquitin-protein ligase RNF170-like [Mya arenaria]
MASGNNRNMWIEGIGDDALLAVGGFFGMFILLVLMVQQRQRQHIHPENVQLAEETREELNHQRAENQTETDDANTQTEGQQEGTPHTRPVRENHGQHDCPVCLGQAEFAIQTNSGHIFCGAGHGPLPSFIQSLPQRWQIYCCLDQHLTMPFSPGSQ